MFIRHQFLLFTGLALYSVFAGAEYAHEALSKETDFNRYQSPAEALLQPSAVIRPLGCDSEDLSGTTPVDAAFRALRAEFCNRQDPGCQPSQIFSDSNTFLFFSEKRSEPNVICRFLSDHHVSKKTAAAPLHVSISDQGDQVSCEQDRTGKITFSAFTEALPNTKVGIFYWHGHNADAAGVDVMWKKLFGMKIVDSNGHIATTETIRLAYPYGSLGCTINPWSQRKVAFNNEVGPEWARLKGACTVQMDRLKDYTVGFSRKVGEGKFEVSMNQQINQKQPSPSLGIGYSNSSASCFFSVTPKGAKAPGLAIPQGPFEAPPAKFQAGAQIKY